MNAPEIFQRIAHKLFGYLPFVTVYINNVIICSKSLDDHVVHIAIVCELILQGGLKLKLNKCCFGVSEVNVLGHVVSRDAVTTNRLKIEWINHAGVSQSENELHSFPMFCSFYRRFVRGFAKIASALHEFTTEVFQLRCNKEANKAF